jgi:hypothetical protein
MVNGKAKGDRFENETCRFLSAWLVDKKYADAKRFKVYDLPFRRRFTDTTPLDGHWNGEGDILHRPGITFPFCVECKDQEGWTFDALVSSSTCPPWKWWEQAVAQANRTDGLWPLMFFTRRYQNRYVMMEVEAAECLRLSPSKGHVVRVQRDSLPPVVVCLAEDLASISRNTVGGLPRTCPTQASSRVERSRSSSRKAMASTKGRRKRSGKDS